MSIYTQECICHIQVCCLLFLLLFFPSRGIGLDRCIFIASVEAEMKFMSFAAGNAEVCLLLPFGFQSSDHENSLASWLS